MIDNEDPDFEDVTPPSVSTKDITVELGPDGTATIAGLDIDGGSTDNCGIETYSVNPNSFDCTNVGIPVTVTLTVTDVNGNLATGTASVTVEDNVAPTVVTKDIAVQLDANGAAIITPADIDNGSSDACGIGTRTLDVNSFDCDDIANNPIVVTLTVNDVNGNSAANTAIVTVVDGIAPQLTAVEDITETPDINCEFILPDYTYLTTATDNCLATPTVTQTPLAGTVMSGHGTTQTITLKAHDDNGNTSSITFNVTLIDNVAPIIADPSDINLNIDAGFCYATINVTTPLTTDNCAVDGVPVGTRSDNQLLTDPYPVGTTTITWTVSDVAGNTATVTQSVTVTDDERPVINAGADISQTSDAGLCSALITIDAATATDNCTVDGLPVGTRSDNQLLTDPYPVGTTTITWTVSDVASNTAIVTQSVTVTDDERPVINAGTDITQTADTGLCSALITIDAATATDNCAVDGVPVGTRSDNQLLTDPYPVGTTTITWTVSDVAGNTSNVTQSVTITDDERPVINAGTDITQTSDTGLCSALITIDAATATDNCTVDGSPVGTRSDNQLLTDPYPVGTTTITWTVSDVAGNTSNVTQSVTVTDDERPVINAGTDITQTADTGLCSALITIDAATATDNCAVDGVPVGTRSDNQLLTDPYPVGTTTITWTVSDVNGNEAIDVTQTITVTDNEAPVINAGADITQTADVGLCSALITIDAATATDNCAVDGVPVGTRSDNQLLTDPYPVGTTTITWTVSDVAGNTSTVTQSVTVTDDERPVINAGTDISQTADTGLCSALISIDAATATDNCAVDGVPVGTRSDNQLLTDPYPVGTTTITWTVSDVAGNTATVTQSVTVTDDERPVINAETDITQTADTGLCSALISIDAATATDNCAVDGVPVGTRSDNQLLTDPYPVGTTTITWTVSDVNGNEAIDVTQTITVTENEAPVINAGADISQTTDAGLCSALITIDAATATDNCAVDGVPVGTRSDNQLITDPYPVGTTTITWTVSDVAGNIATVIQSVTVTDDERPVINAGADITQTTDAGLCSALIAIDAATATDNCTVDGLPVGTRSDNQLLTDPYPVGTTTITWTVSDINGNTATETQIVNVDKITTTINVEIVPSSNTQQYSDEVTITATVSPSNCENAGSATGTVSFYIESQKVGEAELTENGIAAITISLLEDLLGNGTMAPGNKNVTAKFESSHVKYMHSEVDSPVILEITKEDAMLAYTGDELVAVNTRDYSAIINLRAVIQDDDDGQTTRGDIRNATVKFIHMDTGTDLTGWMPVNNLINNYTGVVSTSIPVTLSKNEDARIMTVGVVVNNYYKTSVTEQTSITIYQPVGDFITGGGHIIPTLSTGNYPSDPHSKTNFGFNVKFNKTGKNLQGKLNFIWRSEGRIYQAKSNATISLGVDISSPDEQIAEFTSKCNFTDVTNDLNPISMGGNMIMKVTMTDRGEPGVNDDIAFTMWDGDILVYSSQWTGTNTIKQYLVGGNLVVHSGFNSGDITKENQYIIWSSPEPIIEGTPVSEIQLNATVIPEANQDNLIYEPELGTVLPAGEHTLTVTAPAYSNYYEATTTVQIMVEELNKSGQVVEIGEPVFKTSELDVYPNPFTDRLYFEFISPEPVHAKIDLYDVNGRKVQTIFDNFVEERTTYKAEFKPKKVISAMYFYRMRLGEAVFNGKVIYMKK